MQIPNLSTIETHSIRADYPSIEHLEGGNTAAWLQERKDQLMSRARSGRSELNLTKLLTFTAAAVGGICYATSPLAPIGALIAGIGYAWTVAQDLNETHQFAPVPFIRGDFVQFLSALGDQDAREEYFAQTDAIAELMLHLDPLDRYEFGMLQMHLHTISDYMTQVEPGKRFHAYRWLFTWFCNLRGTFPDKEALTQHLVTVAIDTRVNIEETLAIKDYQVHAANHLVHGLPPIQVSPLPSTPVVSLPSPSAPKPKSEPRVIIPPEPRTPPTPPTSNAPEPQKPETIDVAASPVSVKSSSATVKKGSGGEPDLQQLLKLPLQDRAIAIIETLAAGGFDVARCTENQITCVAGNQRGGKGTLIGILAILASGLSPQTKIHYFTAGDDVYPFRCDRLISRLSYPDLDGASADRKVAIDLFRYLKQLDNSKVGEHSDLILVIDEAVALSDYLKQEQKQWMIRFLLTRLSKKGLQLFLVLHAQNLTSWVGVGNAGGFSSTFKNGAAFIGCEATTKKLSPMKSVSVATGRYFLANPDEFNKPVEDGEIGIIPQWLKSETNPATGQPDPVRSLLKFFPELSTEYADPQPAEEPKEAEPITEPEVVQPDASVEQIEAETVEPTHNSFEELLEAICNSFRGKGAIKIKRIPSGCNRVRTALKQFDEAKHESILMLLVERLIKENRAKLPNNPELEIKVRTNRGSLEVIEEFEIV